jgi:hypothetical protein
MGRVLIALAWIAAASARAAEPLPPLSIPVRIHLVASAAEPALATTLGAEDARRVLAAVNTIWAQAGIAFVAEAVGATTASPRPGVARDDGDRWVVAAMPRERLLRGGLNIFYVKRLVPNGFYADGLIFVKDTARLEPVPGGLDEPLPRVTAHEIGHALGLPHRQDLVNLMASGKNGFLLDANEIAIARATAQARLAAAAAADGGTPP